MPDRDDLHDPMDQAYLRAEEALDDEAARAARRARVLAAVAQDQAAQPPAPALAARGPVRRYGGWLAAACVAGISVITAQQVWRSAPERSQIAPPAAKAPAPAPQTTQAEPPPAAPPPVSATVESRPAPGPVERQAPRLEETAPPVADRLPPPPPPPPPPPVAADSAPPPLPIPPVQKPFAPLKQAPAERSFAPAPAPPPPAAQAKAGVPPTNAQSEVQTVVVTGSRISRRDANAPPPPSISGPVTATPLISGPLKALDGPSRLREAAAAGRTADITALLDQGVPVDADDDSGETALMKSIEANQFDAAVLLRRHGASLDLKNRAGVSARDMAAQKKDLSLDAALGLAR